MRFRRLLPAALLALSSLAAAEVRLPALISDHMVLQRETSVALWGWADPGEEVQVAVSWLAGHAAVTADAEGRWRVEVETGAAGGPYSIRFAASNQIEIEDVVFGEVWVCSGQSNMEWSFDACRPLYEDLKTKANHPKLRLFNVQNVFAPAPREDCSGNWAACTPENLGSFSAVAYFYGLELLTALDVPIGLISSNWGGTVAESWTSEETIRDWPDFADALRRVKTQREDPDIAESRRLRTLESWWKKTDAEDRGITESWASPEYDSGVWPTMDVPNNWADLSLARFDGLVWMRKQVEIPDGWVGQTLKLELGAIDDMDRTYFNGVPVGGYEDAGSWQTPRTYEVPAELVKQGSNLIAVRVYDSGGAGGLVGQKEAIAISASDSSRSIPLAGAWQYQPSTRQQDLANWPDGDKIHQNYPTALFNGMIAPLTNFAIRGAIWYQGESNRNRPTQYQTLFPAMIADWRAHWGRGDFPFYFVQIAPFRYNSDRGQAAELREAQTMALEVPNTGMAVTMDIANPDDIHPKNKLDVGKRLALWALAKTYGQEISTWSGPLLREMKIEGDTIRLYFDHVGEGLVLEEAQPHFRIAGPTKRFVEAKAWIDGETIVVRGEACPVPRAVRYAWGAADEGTLKNAAGLPAPPFRTDDWQDLASGQ